MNCPELRELVQRWLDGEMPAPDQGEAADHLGACPSCRQLLRAARLVRDTLGRSLSPVPPERLSRRILERLLGEARRRTRARRLLIGAALAATLLLGAGTFLVLSRPGADSTQVLVNPSPRASVPSFHQHVEEAGEAFVSLTQRAARKTVDESRLFFPDVTPPALAANQVFLETLEPSTQPLEEIKRGMSVGLEPVTSSARRALDLFLGEIPQKETGQRKGS
jgi:anti-sigma factor RsiW